MFERIARWWRIRKYDREHPEERQVSAPYRPEVETSDAWAAGAASHSLGMGTGTAGGGAPPGAEMPPNYVHAYDEGRPRK
jgi:hypothetical protein